MIENDIDRGHIAGERSVRKMEMLEEGLLKSTRKNIPSVDDRNEVDEEKKK